MIKTALLYLYTESALHVGVGSGISAIDLPIQRERITQFPNIQGSGVKGALRSQCTTTNGYNSEKDPTIQAIFGSDTSENSHAGAVSFGEARVVLFPVRSLMGIYAYVTTPLALQRLYREAERAGIKGVGEATPRQ